MRRILYILLPFILLAACKQKPVDVEKPEKQIPVKTAPVHYEKVRFPIRVAGLISSAEQVKLSFKIGGIIRDIGVKEGQQVSKGTVLAQLDLKEIEAQMMQAEAQVEKLQRDYDSALELYEDSVITGTDLKDTKTALDIAKSQLEIAQFNYDHATIRAPQNGKIVAQLFEENELIGAGMPVFLFASGEGLWVVKIGVSDKDRVKLEVGDSALVYLDAYANDTLSGVVTEMAEALDPRSGTFEVQVQIDAGDRKIVDGLAARMDLLPQGSKELAIIPLKALVDPYGMKGFVFYVDPENDIAHKESIDIALIRDKTIVVSSGLENIDAVVTDGSAYLWEGAKVKF